MAPSTWQVVKVADRLWHLDNAQGVNLGGYRTRKEAEAGKVSGAYVTLWEKEGRWMRGDTPAGWRPYADVKAEHERREAQREERYRGYAIHFVLDWKWDLNTALGATGEPTDDNIRIVLRNCARRPHPLEYPEIRRHVEAYRAELEAQSAAACE